ncbi:serine/threonine-protein kinase [Aquisphaera insulae]|uniref:serine/threonine-protein kinase n=1 Tax=Aquisphaera insulae TaxID=2712864 RepID=UPI0013ECBFA7|nr:serine/threonine-protein kinase [Aquisphaera insulae]
MRPTEPVRPGRPERDPADSPPADLSDYALDETDTLRYEAESPPPGGSEARAMSPPTTIINDSRQFLRIILEKGLVPAADLAALRDRLVGPGSSLELSRLASELVRLRKLTPYQVAAIRQGKTRGLVIGDYVVVDKIGAGGMGLVFRVRHPRTTAELALKLLSPSISRDSAAVARFRREVAAVARLSHPNIVTALDSGETRGLLFLVMEYVDGRDLARAVRESGSMTVGRAVDCVIQAARGLKEAHDRGIIHRDIKPANLLLERSGVVKVLDLGLARVSQGIESSPGDGSETDLTVSGVIVGTVDYMAPEQAYDPRLADPRSDVYSLGCTLHYLLTGRAPYGGKSFMERMLGHRERPIPSLRNQRDDVPVPLDDFFCRMMGKSVAVRPQSMAEVIAGLEGSKGKRRARAASTGKQPASRPPRNEDRFDPESIYGLVDRSMSEPAPSNRNRDVSNVYVRRKGENETRLETPSVIRRRGRRRRLLLGLAGLAVALVLGWLIGRRRR